VAAKAYEKGKAASRLDGVHVVVGTKEFEAQRQLGRKGLLVQGSLFPPLTLDADPQARPPS
jgi:hypothetical protein